MIGGAIEHMLKDIKLYIPEELLKETFHNENKEFNRSLDGIIKEKIIVDIVLRKCNLYAGKLAKIELKQDWVENVRNDSIFPYGGDQSYYRIPPEAREYRDIISVIDIIYPMNAPFTYIPFNSGYQSLLSKTNELYETTFGTGEIRPVPRLRQGNVIFLDPPIMFNDGWILVCMLGYDSSFGNVSINMIKPLADLAVLATKMYIYNKLKLKVDMAYVHGGHELGTFKEMIESYSDASEKFEESLMKFRGSALFDEDTVLSLINLLV